MSRAALLVALAAGSFACSGARSYVVAPRAEVPISMSEGLRGTDGQLLAPGDKHVVGEFSFNYKAWGMLWRAISFTGEKDISEEVNRQVKEAGGDAVNNLQVFSGNCTWNAVTFIGLFPDCANVEIKGDIVKVAPSRTTTATAQRQETAR